MLDRIRDPKLAGVLVSSEGAAAFLVEGVSRTKRRKAVLFMLVFLSKVTADINVYNQGSRCREQALLILEGVWSDRSVKEKE